MSIFPESKNTSRSTIREELLRDLHKEDFRYDYDEEFLNTYISAQIRALRDDRKLTQSELAMLAKTGQSQISEMEGEYHSWSLRTLRKLARALGVRLFVSFESWGELIPRVEGFHRETLVRPIIERDPAFTTGAAVAMDSTMPIPSPVDEVATTDNVLQFHSEPSFPFRERRPPRKVFRRLGSNDWTKVSADA